MPGHADVLHQHSAWRTPVSKHDPGWDAEVVEVGEGIREYLNVYIYTHHICKRMHYVSTCIYICICSYICILGGKGEV